MLTPEFKSVIDLYSECVLDLSLVRDAELQIVRFNAIIAQVENEST